MNVSDWVATNGVDPMGHEYLTRLSAKVAAVSEAYPTVPAITALIMAGDALAADRATAMVEDGVPFDEALPFVGSYARIGWMLDMAEADHIPLDRLLDLFPRYWPGSDPDDTDPRLLAVWENLWRLNGRSPVTDGEPLPPGRTLAIYRGQGAGDPLGMAWTLDPTTAARFAAGASLRVRGAVIDPVIVHSRVHRRQVFAYLTNRGEAEVIIDPIWLAKVTMEPWHE